MERSTRNGRQIVSSACVLLLVSSFLSPPRPALAQGADPNPVPPPEALPQDADQNGVSPLEPRVQQIEQRLDEWTSPHPSWNLGIGYGIAVNATDGDDNDSSGLLLHLKAYPTRTDWQEGDSLSSEEDQGKSWWWLNCDRVSIVAGLSVGEFTGGGIEGPVWVVGAGYDIVDELALVIGWSWFEFEKEGGRKDTDGALYFAAAFDPKIFQRFFAPGR